MCKAKITISWWQTIPLNHSWLRKYVCSNCKATLALPKAWQVASVIAMVVAMTTGFILVGAYTYANPLGFLMLRKNSIDIYILLKVLAVGVVSFWLSGVVALRAPRLIDCSSIEASWPISLATVFFITLFIVIFLATGFIYILLKRTHGA